VKIAIVTNDSRSISAHFGRARRYLVLTVEQGAVVAREEREKPAHSHSHHHHDHDQHDGHDHDQHDGHDHEPLGVSIALTATAPDPATIDPGHNTAAELIADCTVVLSRGMGKGMYANLERTGVRPVLTTIVLIDEAVAAFLAGTLEEHPELVH